MDIDKLIEGLIRKHTGGEKFFDALDKEVRNPDYINRLFVMLYEDCGSKGYSIFNYGIVVSGKFGIYFVNNYPEQDSILVNGSLRDNDIIDLSFISNRIRGKSFVFFDDSYYKGRTEAKIREEIKRNGGRLVRTYVVYNGSKNSNIRSIYSYYGV